MAVKLVSTRRESQLWVSRGRDLSKKVQELANREIEHLSNSEKRRKCSETYFQKVVNRIIGVLLMIPVIRRITRIILVIFNKDLGHKILFGGEDKGTIIDILNAPDIALDVMKKELEKSDPIKNLKRKLSLILQLILIKKSEPLLHDWILVVNLISDLEERKVVVRDAIADYYLEVESRCKNGENSKAIIEDLKLISTPLFTELKGLCQFDEGAASEEKGADDEFGSAVLQLKELQGGRTGLDLEENLLRLFSYLVSKSNSLFVEWFLVLEKIPDHEIRGRILINALAQFKIEFESQCVDGDKEEVRGELRSIAEPLFESVGLDIRDDTFDRNALDFAACYGDPDIIEALLRRGAKITGLNRVPNGFDDTSCTTVGVLKNPSGNPKASVKEYQEYRRLSPVTLALLFDNFEALYVLFREEPILTFYEPFYHRYFVDFVISKLLGSVKNEQLLEFILGQKLNLSNSQYFDFLDIVLKYKRQDLLMEEFESRYSSIIDIGTSRGNMVVIEFALEYKMELSDHQFFWILFLTFNENNLPIRALLLEDLATRYKSLITICVEELQKSIRNLKDPAMDDKKTQAEIDVTMFVLGQVLHYKVDLSDEQRSKIRAIATAEKNESILRKV